MSMSISRCLREIKLISRKSVKGREQKLIDILEQKLGVWVEISGKPTDDR